VNGRIRDGGKKGDVHPTSQEERGNKGYPRFDENCRAGSVGEKGVKEGEKTEKADLPSSVN